MRISSYLKLDIALAFVFTGMTIAQPAAADPTLVKIDSGTVRGVAAGSVTSFKGIPYAAPPVGKLRWRVPQPVSPWPGVLAAEKFGPSCLQTDNIPKSEDCLTINVWRPAAISTRTLPVMVWIYGGAMVHGTSAIYPLDGMAAKGIVMLSMNFRLGRLGYFAHPALAAEAPNDVRGNYGFMDQLAALKWVKRNIAAFGGDAHQVTIFGESAGAGSVLAHLVSPISRGLFQRAILQSPRARRRRCPETHTRRCRRPPGCRPDRAAAPPALVAGELVAAPRGRARVGDVGRIGAGGQRDRVDRRAGRLQRDGFGRPAISKNAGAAELRIDIVAVIGSARAAKAAGSVIGDVVAAVGDCRS